MLTLLSRATNLMKSRRRRRIAQRRLLKRPQPYQLHLGCGDIHFPEWIHLDANPALSHIDAVWFAQDGLPCPDASCQYIYSEHFLEHLNPQDGLNLLKECRRVLQPGGVLRIAMPDMRECVRQYMDGDWQQQPWLEKYGYTWIKTGCEMVNICFREWGHLWLYDREELHRRLHEAGFTQITDVGCGESDHIPLQNRETRRESSLVCEAS